MAIDIQQHEQSDGKIPKRKTTSYYVATIYDLCKNASQLDSDEQKLVVKELDRLINLVPTHS